MFSHIDSIILSYGMIKEEDSQAPYAFLLGILFSSTEYNSAFLMNVKYFSLNSYINICIFLFFLYLIYFKYIISLSYKVIESHKES